MNEKTKKILIYGGIGIGIIGGGVFVYIKYFNNQNLNQNNSTSVTPTNSATPNNTNGLGMTAAGLSLPYFSEAAPSEFPIASIATSNASPIINPAPVQGTGNLNNFIQQELNQNNVLSNTNLNQYTIPTPVTPNLNLPQVSQIKSTPMLNNPIYAMLV